MSCLWFPIIMMAHFQDDNVLDGSEHLWSNHHKLCTINNVDVPIIKHCNTDSESPILSTVVLMVKFPVHEVHRHVQIMVAFISSLLRMYTCFSVQRF